MLLSSTVIPDQTKLTELINGRQKLDKAIKADRAAAELMEYDPIPEVGEITKKLIKSLLFYPVNTALELLAITDGLSDDLRIYIAKQFDAKAEKHLRDALANQRAWDKD